MLCNLKDLQVEDCSEIEEITEGGSIVEIRALPKLKNVVLCRLPRLFSICEGVSFEWRSLARKHGRGKKAAAPTSDVRGTPLPCLFFFFHFTNRVDVAQTQADAAPTWAILVRIGRYRRNEGVIRFRPKYK